METHPVSAHSLPADALILAVDIGTSSVRAMIFTREGHPLEHVFAQQKHQAQTTPDGGATFDADEMVERVQQCIDTVIEQTGDQAQQIGAVAMDMLVSNLIGVGANGRAITPMFTWADIRGAELVDAWRDRLAAIGLSPQDYTDQTGCRLHTSYWPVRLLWLQMQHPDLFRQAAHWMSFGDYLYFRLFGERRISYSAASWTGLHNRHALTWHEGVLSALGLRAEQLSTLGDVPIEGKLDRSGRWPALQAARWFPAIGDGVASNLGAGCSVPGRVALSVGTSGALRVIVPGSPERVPSGLFGYRVDGQRTLIGGPLSNAGNLYAWMQNTLQLAPDADSRIAAMEPASHGLTVLPFLAGERAPGWNAQAQAALLGMTFNTAPEHILRAGLEAVAYRFGQIADRLAPLLPPEPYYVASGAAVLNSPVWMQIIADVLGAAVYATTETETTIRGAVYLAAGYEPDPPLGQCYRPDPARHTIYQAAKARQQALYERLFAVSS